MMNVVDVKLHHGAIFFFFYGLSVAVIAHMRFSLEICRIVVHLQLWSQTWRW